MNRFPSQPKFRRPTNPDSRITRTYLQPPSFPHSKYDWMRMLDIAKKKRPPNYINFIVPKEFSFKQIKINTEATRSPPRIRHLRFNAPRISFHQCKTSHHRSPLNEISKWEQPDHHQDYEF